MYEYLYQHDKNRQGDVISTRSILTTFVCISGLVGDCGPAIANTLELALYFTK